VVFQHTGDWVLRAYARAAPFPRGTTVAQDFFELGLLPADTDYRMFSYRHYGALPGIDVAFLFGGTAYHTARDEAARIRPGTLQAMGQNMGAAVAEFARVLGAGAPALRPAAPPGEVFFDLLSSAMVVYSHRAAAALHNLPLAVLLALSMAAAAGGPGARGAAARVPPPALLLRAAGAAAASTLGALLLPAAVGAARALISGVPMVWYGRPYVALAIYIPAALAGLLLPYSRTTAGAPAAPLPKAGGASPAERARAQSLGTALFYSAFACALNFVGMHSAYLFAAWAAGALAAALLAPARRLGWRAGGAAVAGFAAPLVIALPTAACIVLHVMEKIGMAGSAPGALGRAIPDAAIGVVAGAATFLTLGTALPYLLAGAGAGGGRGARPAVALLLAASVGAAGWASVGVGHPYSWAHPKRVLVQHVHRHTPQASGRTPCLCMLHAVFPPLLVRSRRGGRRPRALRAWGPPPLRNARFLPPLPPSLPAAHAPPNPRSPRSKTIMRCLPAAGRRHRVALHLQLSGRHPRGRGAAARRRRRAARALLQPGLGLLLPAQPAVDGHGSRRAAPAARRARPHADPRGSAARGRRRRRRRRRGRWTGGGRGVRAAPPAAGHGDPRVGGDEHYRRRGGVVPGGGGRGHAAPAGKRAAPPRPLRPAATTPNAPPCSQTASPAIACLHNSPNFSIFRTLLTPSPPPPASRHRHTPVPRLQGGGACHMVRYASSSATSRFVFWLDAPAGRPLRVELFVKHLAPAPATSALVDAMPEWASVTAVTTWQSVWEFA
jgi:hypothetical protein